MKCSRCGAEMKIKNVQVGTDQRGIPIYHKCAFCYHCKIKRDLDRTLSVSSTRSSTRKRKQRVRRRLLTLSFLLLIVFFVSCSVLVFKKINTKKKSEEQKNTVVSSRDNIIAPKDFNDIKIGMSRDEITDAIGSSGSLLTKATSNTDQIERYQWVTKDKKGTVLLTFYNNKVISLSQTGMKDTEQAEVSVSSASNVRGGMTLEEVNTAFGNNGIRMSETIFDGATTSVYEWYIEGHSSKYTGVFVDGILQKLNQP